MARDFDTGITGPPRSVSMDFIAQGLVDLLGGAALTAHPVRLSVVGLGVLRGAGLVLDPLASPLLRAPFLERTATPMCFARP